MKKREVTLSSNKNGTPDPHWKDIMNKHINRQRYVRLIAKTVFCACIIFSQGCGTISTLSSNDKFQFRTESCSQYIYSGTRYDMELIKDCHPTDHTPGLLKVFPVIDVPFSCVLDTILLPLTFPAEMLYEFDNMF